jgi:hypothetical protein
MKIGLDIIKHSIRASLGLPGDYLIEDCRSLKNIDDSFEWNDLLTIFYEIPEPFPGHTILKDYFGSGDGLTEKGKNMMESIAKDFGLPGTLEYCASLGIEYSENFREKNKFDDLMTSFRPVDIQYIANYILNQNQ